MSSVVSPLPAYLPSLFTPAASAGTTAGLLGTLYGYTSGTSIGASGNPVLALQSAEQNETKQVALTAKQPDTARDVATFKAAVTAATSVQQLLSNPTVMKVLLTANGLADQIPYTALATKTLTSQINDSKSLVSQLTDTRWKSVVQTYDFANKGLSVIQNPAVLDTIANAYAEVTWRQSLDATTPGLSNALTFRGQASSITSVDQILGDPVMRTVVTTAVGIPQEIALQYLSAQEQAISSRLDISQFKDPQFTERFIQRYLIAAAQGTSTSSPATLESLAMQSQGLVV